MSLHARTSAWNQTVYDPHVNLLRATTEAFSGAVGGCDSLHISPFDELLRVPDEFSRRVARNTHTVLREESHITRTVDPAGGSWYVENLTDSVARKTWAIFQEVEKQGGMAKALEAGWPQAQIADTAAKRAANIAKRKDIFVGTNMYPNLKETRIEPAAVDAWAVQTERTEALKGFRATANAAGKQAALDALAKSGGVEPRFRPRWPARLWAKSPKRPAPTPRPAPPSIPSTLIAARRRSRRCGKRRKPTSPAPVSGRKCFSPPWGR
jgi:methylmalonyl-CoA mutase